MRSADSIIARLKKTQIRNTGWETAQRRGLAQVGGKETVNTIDEFDIAGVILPWRNEAVHLASAGLAYEELCWCHGAMRLCIWHLLVWSMRNCVGVMSHR
jgi:hypothetical protein